MACAESVTGISSTYFAVEDNIHVLRGDVLTGRQERIFLMPDTVARNTSYFIHAPIPFIDQRTGDTMLVAAPNLSQNDTPKPVVYLLLYNLTKRREVYRFIQRANHPSVTSVFNQIFDLQDNRFSVKK